MLDQKTVLITGATGGLGLITAKLLADNGWIVYAADCNEKALGSIQNHTNIVPIFMDVSERSSVEKAFFEYTKSHNHLDAIINFAGILRVGSISEMNESELEKLLNINVLGTFRVNQIFIPLLLEHRKGRVINISSETGWQSGGPFNGAYAMSKHAIEAYSDSLRRELMFLDIPVIKIQPGPFKTDMVKSIEINFSKAIESTVNFKIPLTKTKEFALKEQVKAHSPDIIAQTVLTALNAKNPKAAYSVKADFSRTLLEYLPVSWADWILRKVLAG
ncbi:MAG: SDR family NAD(P)-dependent oxidoreductase [Halioglobus sp.]